MKLLLSLILSLFIVFVKSSSSSSSSSSSNSYILTNYYAFMDTKCFGETFSYAYDESGFCENGATFQCQDDGSILVQEFSNSNCTGDVVFNSNLPTNVCTNAGTLQFTQKCVNNIKLPTANYFMSVISDSCDWKNKVKSIGVRKTGICQYTGTMSSLDIYCNQTSYIQHVYESSICAGNPTIYTSPIPECQQTSNGLNMIQYFCN